MAINPLLQGSPQSNGKIQNLSRVKQMISEFRNNPQQAVARMMQSNPNMKEINDLVNRYGSPEQAFRHKAQEMGVNPDEIISLFK